MNTCILCKIIRHEAPSNSVYEDEQVLAFMDIQPINPGHVLIVPKEHVEFVSELADNTVAQLSIVAKKINSALRKSGLKVEGVNHFIADGEAAGQEVAHVHLHVFPRHKKDGFGFKFPDQYLRLPTDSDLKEVAQKIRSKLQKPAPKVDPKKVN